MNNLCFFFCFGLLSVFTVYNYTERKIWTFVRSFEIFLTSKRFTITISYTVRCIFCLIKKKTLSLSFYQIKYKCVFFAFCIFNCCHQTLNSLIYIWVTILHARNCLHRLEHQFKSGAIYNFVHCWKHVGFSESFWLNSSVNMCDFVFFLQFLCRLQEKTS